MSVVGWIFTAGVFVFGMAATYPVAGPGGSLLSGGFLALMYLARVAIHTRPSAPSEPIALNAYGRAALANLVDAFARAPDDDMRGHDLVRRGRAPSDRELVGLIGLAAFMQRCHYTTQDSTDYSAMWAGRAEVRSLFKLIYGWEPNSYEDRAFTNLISSAYPKEGSASLSVADASAQDPASASR